MSSTWNKEPNHAWFLDEKEPEPKLEPEDKVTKYIVLAIFILAIYLMVKHI